MNQIIVSASRRPPTLQIEVAECLLGEVSGYKNRARECQNQPLGGQNRSWELQNRHLGIKKSVFGASGALKSDSGTTLDESGGVQEPKK